MFHVRNIHVHGTIYIDHAQHTIPNIALTMSEHEKEMRKIVFIYFVLIKSRQSDQRVYKEHSIVLDWDETLYNVRI